MDMADLNLGIENAKSVFLKETSDGNVSKDFLNILVWCMDNRKPGTHTSHPDNTLWDVYERTAHRT